MSCDTVNTRAEKRSYDDQAENHDESPPKIITTPQRSRGKKDAQHDIITTPRTRSRTPLVERNDRTKDNTTPASRTRSKSPMSQKRSATVANLTPNTKSKSKALVSEGSVKSTPTVNTRARNLVMEKQESFSTPTPTPRSRGRLVTSKNEMKFNSSPVTRSRSQTPVSQKESIITPRRTKSSCRDDSKTRTKIPVPVSKATAKHTDSAFNTGSTSKDTKNENENPVVDMPKAEENIIEDKRKEVEDLTDNNNEVSQNQSDSNEESKETCLSSSDSTDEVSQVTSDLSGSENTVPEVKKELQKEMEKVKRRRSTLGRSRKSIQCMGGRQSLCVSMPVLSLLDQVNRIPKDLPQTSKVSQLLDISIREALRRLEQRLEGDEYVADLRQDLVTQSEEIAGQLSYAIAGQPLVSEDISTSSSLSEDKEDIHERVVAYKKKTKELEEEYKTWKTLMKQRKHMCQAAEREFREAKSGETKIEEDQIKQMTNVHRNLLASRPNYHQYIQELQTVRERALLMLQGVKHTTEVVSSFINMSKSEAESCYSAVEELSFGFLKNRPVKNVLKSIIEPGEIANNN